MRLFEWFFVFAFIPQLLLPFVSEKFRRSWSIGAIVLLAFAAALQLWLEGWRFQMLPLYGLAVLVLLGRGLSLWRPETLLRRKRGIILSMGIGILLLAGGVLAGYLLPVLNFSETSGAYAVGFINRELLDTARNRRLMVTIWYPADAKGEAGSMTEYPNEVATALSNLSGLPAFLYQHLGYFKLAASENASILSENAPFPVLVFSHGMVGLRLQNSSTLQNLASQGYVVVAIDHTDAAAVTVFPDGEAAYYNLSNFGVPAELEPTRELMNQHVFPAWVADQIFVYDLLEEWAASDALLGGRLDLSRIGSFGHSFGGATALEVCRLDARCRAAVNMDGALYGTTAESRASYPLLLMISADSQQYEETMAAWSALITNAEASAYWLELPNSTHFSFTITQLLSPLLVPDGFDAYAGLETIDKYLALFFDEHLRGTGEMPTRDADVNWLND